MLVRATFQEPGTGSDGAARHPTTVTFLAGHSLLEVAQSKGIPINAPCGGRGSCGKCLVRVLSGNAPATADDKAMLSDGMLREGLRLSCQLRPLTPIRVEVQSRFDLRAAPRVTPFGLAKSLPDCVDIAVDLGSTSVQISPIDVNTGHVSGEASVLNRQVRHGHDVMTRLTHALKGADSRDELTQDALATLKLLLDSARGRLFDKDAKIRNWYVAANTAMTSLLWSADITHLAEAPYAPPFTEERSERAEHFELPGETLTTFPLLGSFVGGDTAAAIIATDLDRPGLARMLIDIGTNTEIVLAHANVLYACSTPAGPAFEGGNISVGMRAEEGAIVRIEVRDDGSIRASTIGSVKPKGICGTGLFEALDALVRAGLIGRDGTVKAEDGRIALAKGVDLLQLDIRELQLAKGALRTAIKILGRTAGITDAELGALFVAGAFGSHLNPDIAVHLKMFPDVDPSLIKAVGNAALEGAIRFARDPSGIRDRLADIQAKTRHIELATRDDFQDIFVESLNF